MGNKIRSIIVFFPLLSGFCFLHPQPSTVDTPISGKVRQQFYKNVIQQPQIYSISEQIAAYDSLIRMTAETPEPDVLGHCRLRIGKGKLLEQTGDYIGTFWENSAAADLLQSTYPETKLGWEVCDLLNDCRYNLGVMSLNMGLYDRSSSYFYEVLSNHPEINRQVRTLSVLSSLYIHLGQLALAEEHIFKAGALIDTASFVSDIAIDTTTLFIYSNARSGFLYETGAHEAALAEMDRTGIFAGASGDPKNIISYNQNLASLYWGLGELVLAKKCLQNIIDIQKNNHVRQLSFVVALFNMGSMLFAEQTNDSALIYYKAALEMARTVGSRKWESRTLIAMSSIYREGQDYERALDLITAGYRLNDSVMGADIMAEVMIQSRNFDRQILASNLLITELKNRNKTFVTVFLILALAVVLTLSGFIFFRYHKRLRQEQMDNKKLYAVLEHLKSSSSEELEKQQRHQMVSSLMLLQSNEMFDTLRSIINKMKNSEAYSACTNLVGEMETVLNQHTQHSVWDEFHLYFEEIHPDFFKALQTKYPHLSQNEERCCALLYLSLSTKEIAAIMHRSVRTIENTIYAIRKKLNIPTKEKVRHFLLTMLK